MIDVVGRIPHVLQANEHNRVSLEAKPKRSGHYIDFGGRARLPEQSDAVQIEGMPQEAGDQPT